MKTDSGRKIRSALVTGCSSGIGRATALRLHRAGYAVYATARNSQALAELAEEGLVCLSLDVNDEPSAVAAVDRIVADHGAVGVLVNNAGFELISTIEDASLNDVQRQFDTNLFAAIRLIKLVLPGMRAHGYGRIVNLSSIFGAFAVPGAGFYAASKHAVEGLTDSLRLEISGFGIRAMVVQPTVTRTSFEGNAAWSHSSDQATYGDFYRRLKAWYQATYRQPATNVAGRFAVTADDVADAVVRAVRSRRPRARYPVGTLARGLLALRRWLPRPAFDAFVRMQFPTPSNLVGLDSSRPSLGR